MAMIMRIFMDMAVVVMTRIVMVVVMVMVVMVVVMVMSRMGMIMPTVRMTMAMMSVPKSKHAHQIDHKSQAADSQKLP